MLLNSSSPENQEIIELSNHYFDIEKDTDKRLEIIENIADFGTQNALYISGAMFQENAVDPNTSASDRRDYFSEANNLWTLALEDWDNKDVAPAVIYSGLGLAAIKNTLRISSKVVAPVDATAVRDMYLNSIDVAQKALDLRAHYNLREDKENAVACVYALNQLTTLLLMQRHRISNPEFEYLAMPAQISQNRRLFNPLLTSTSWDSSIYKTGDRVELGKKIQSRTSLKAEVVEGEILTVNNGKVLALDKREYKKEIKSFELMSTIVREAKNMNGVNIGTDRTLNRRTLNLLKVVIDNM